MKTGLIVCDESDSRNALMIALELDERLQGLGADPVIYDMQDASYRLSDLSQLDGIILITGHTGPLYAAALHQLLCHHRHLWRGRQIATTMISNEKMVAEAADQLLRSALRNLGAKVLPEHLLVLNVKEKFDEHFQLKDAALNLAMYRFLHTFVYGQENAKKRQIA